MYSFGSPHMAVQKQDDQLEHTYSRYVMIRDVALKTCQKRWMIGRSGEKGSGISVLAMMTINIDFVDTAGPCPVGWGCRIYRLHPCRGIRHPQRVSWIWHKQPDGAAPVMLELWGMRNTLSLPSLSGSLWPWVVAPYRVLSMGQIELNYIIMLNWIAWKRTVLPFKLCTYSKLNCLK